MPFRTLHLRAALTALIPLLAASVPAQTHRTEKPEKVTRAIGVYEWTGDLNKPTASRLVPISLFIDGHLEDAGVYLSRPVPFALSAGFVYAVEKAGEPIGTVDLDEARNIVSRRSSDDDNSVAAWYGYGRYIPPAAAQKTPALKTTAHPSAIVSSGSGSGASESRPHLSTRADDEAAPGLKPDKQTDNKNPSTAGPQPTATTAPTADSKQPAETTSSPTSSDDSDRPHMSRRSENSTPDASSSTASTASSANTPADDDPERPTLRRRDVKAEPKKRGKESGSGVTGMARSLNDDPDRPTLRRGAEDVPAATPPLSGTPPDLRQAVAVSDATANDNHPFARAWESPAERASTLAAFQALARPRVANYLTLNQLKPGTALVQPAAAAQPSKTAPQAIQQGSGEDAGGPPKLQRGRPSQTGAAQGSGAQTGTPAPIPSKASTATSASAPKAPARASAHTPGHRPASAPAPLLLQEEQLTGFTLSYGGLPTFVYTAITPTSEGASVHITLVAQQLPSGELQVALSSVTDEAHLDRTPWMRLVDVVDPSDSHRASFVFELRAKASRQFALYSLVSAHAEQSFVTGLMQ